MTNWRLFSSQIYQSALMLLEVGPRPVRYRYPHHSFIQWQKQLTPTFVSPPTPNLQRVHPAARYAPPMGFSFYLGISIISAIGLLAACRKAEEPYPSRELMLIVQASPGGISDTVSRVMASLLERDLGVPVVCENKPGASGALAFSYVVRRAPDGYSLGHAPVEVSIVRTLGYADVGPDNMGLICLVAKTPAALVVRNDAPWSTFEEFVADARATPGGLILGHSGTGSIWHFNALLMEKAADIRA